MIKEDEVHVPQDNGVQVQPVYYEEEKSNSHKWQYGIIAVLLAVLVGGDFFAYDRYSKQKNALREQHLKDINDSIAKVKADSIAEIAKAEQARIDSINRVKEMRETIFREYNQTLNDISKGKVYDSDWFNPNDLDEYYQVNCDYFLYDITRDGIPELWVVFGTYEMNTTLRVYSCQNGKCKHIYETSAGHSVYYEGSNYILVVWALQGSASWTKLKYINGRIIEDSVFEENNIDSSEDYTVPKEKECRMYSHRNIQPIKKALEQ